VPAAAAAGKIQVSSISASISNTAGQTLLHLTAHAHRQDYYKPGWFVTTVVHRPDLLAPVVSALNAAAGTGGHSYVLQHGQQLLQLPLERLAGLSGVKDEARRAAGHMEYDHIAWVNSAAVYEEASRKYGSIRRGLHELPEETEYKELSKVASCRAEVEAYQQRQQQQRLAANAAADMPLELLVTTGGEAGSQQGVTTLFEVRIPAAAVAAAAGTSSVAAYSTAGSSSAAAGFAPGSSSSSAGRVIAKALLSYHRAASNADAVVPGSEKPLLEQTAQPIPRMAPCLEWIEVQGAWREKGIGRRLLQV
jgi:hypothetical protein